MGEDSVHLQTRFTIENQKKITIPHNDAHGYDKTLN